MCHAHTWWCKGCIYLRSDLWMCVGCGHATTHQMPRGYTETCVWIQSFMDEFITHMQSVDATSHIQNVDTMSHATQMWIIITRWSGHAWMCVMHMHDWCLCKRINMDALNGIWWYMRFMEKVLSSSENNESAQGCHIITNNDLTVMLSQTVSSWWLQ